MCEGRLGGEDPHLLVVEDDPIILMLAERILARRGYRVTTARNGVEALERWGERWFDALVTDLRMPLMGGVRLATELRASAPDLPVVVLTACLELEDEAGLGSLAGDPVTVLAKPFD